MRSVAGWGCRRPVASKAGRAVNRTAEMQLEGCAHRVVVPERPTGWRSGPLGRCVAFLWRGNGRAKGSFGCFASSSQCCQTLAGANEYLRVQSTGARRAMVAVVTAMSVSLGCAVPGG